MYSNTCKATVGFLKKNREKVIQWPSMSPYLNPIEHLWGILKRQVEHHSPSSIQSLKEVILEEWKKIDQAKRCQLVHSMPRRLGAVIKNHGGHKKVLDLVVFVVGCTCYVCKEDAYLNLFDFLLFSSTLLNCIN